LVGHHKETLGKANGGKEEGVGNNDALFQGVAATEWHVEVKARTKQLEWLGEDVRHHHFTAEWDAKVLIAVIEQEEALVGGKIQIKLGLVKATSGDEARLGMGSRGA
jgi:hypothetical protein